MSPRDLLSEPCWQGADLGHPLPDATHAVSMALPRWQAVSYTHLTLPTKA